MKARQFIRSVTLSLVAGMVLLAGCSPTTGPRAPVPDRNVISEADLEVLDPGMTAAQTIQRLRPNWLTGRGATQTRGAEPVIPVYVNGQRSGDDRILDRVAVRAIRELRFLDSITATQLYGTGHPSGAVMIILR
jgi:hypothetical protein